MVPPEVLCDAATFRLAARWSLEVSIAVRPGDLDRVGKYVELSLATGVQIALWPMIDDAAGRWLSVESASAFRTFVRELRARVADVALVLDLEPPLPLVRGALDGHRAAFKGLFDLVRGTPAHLEGERTIAAMCDEESAHGRPPMLAVVPFVLFDGARPGWGRLFGPSRPLAAGRVNVMLYSTLIAGYSRGLLGRDDALALLFLGAREARRRFGDRAAVSLGAVGTGALGDEPVYADPGELSLDVAVALSAGARELWLFDLGGALSRGAPERWLEAFVTPKDVAIDRAITVRSRAVAALLRTIGWGLSAVANAENGTNVGRI